MFCDGGLACGFSQSVRNTHDEKGPDPAHPVQCRNVYEYTCYARGGVTLNKCAEMMQASKGSSRMTDGEGISFD